MLQHTGNNAVRHWTTSTTLSPASNGAWRALHAVVVLHPRCQTNKLCLAQTASAPRFESWRGGVCAGGTTDKKKKSDQLGPGLQNRHRSDQTGGSLPLPKYTLTVSPHLFSSLRTIATVTSTVRNRGSSLFMTPHQLLHAPPHSATQFLAPHFGAILPSLLLCLGIPI